MKYLRIIIFICISNISFGQTDSTSNDTTEAEQPIELSSDTSQIEIVNESFDKLVEKLTSKQEDKDSIWTILIPLLIGAGLTLITQVIIEIPKSKKQKKERLSEVKAEIHRLTLLIKDHYRELAMHKAHKFYWYAQFQFENALKEPDKAESDKFYNYHMTSSGRVRDTELKLAENFANYYKEINRLQMYTSFKKEIEGLITEYQDFVPEKPEDIWSENRVELQKLENEEEKKLRNSYKQYGEILDKINSHLL